MTRKTQRTIRPAHANSVDQKTTFQSSTSRPNMRLGDHENEPSDRCQRSGYIWRLGVEGKREGEIQRVSRALA